jgi:hypothetical protein
MGEEWQIRNAYILVAKEEMLLRSKKKKKE